MAKEVTNGTLDRFSSSSLTASKFQDMLIICDWTSSEFSPGKPISVLKDAITIWDHGTVYTGPPYLLEGGFEKFLYAYPHNVTNPKARAPVVEKVPSVSSIPSLDINYPDLDNGDQMVKLCILLASCFRFYGYTLPLTQVFCSH